jgi:hypothetical protein
VLPRDQPAAAPKEKLQRTAQVQLLDLVLPVRQFLEVLRHGK